MVIVGRLVLESNATSAVRKIRRLRFAQANSVLRRLEA